MCSENFKKEIYSLETCNFCILLVSPSYQSFNKADHNTFIRRTKHSILTKADNQLLTSKSFPKITFNYCLEYYLSLNIKIYNSQNKAPTILKTIKRFMTLEIVKTSKKQKRSKENLLLPYSPETH